VNRWRLNYVASLLLRDAVIAYPTEGVWGLGCIPESWEAVARILALKNRRWQEGLLLVAADISQLEPYLTGLAEREIAELESAWPGPVTYLVPDNGVAPGWIVGGHETLGLRVTDHPLVRSLCELSGPLVSTSANVSGRPAAMSALEVHRYFDGRIDCVVPGDLGGTGRSSEIRVLATGEVIR